MSHRTNYDDAGHAHELTFSCYQRFPFLKSDRTCEWLAESIDAARRDFKFQLWAYVFMPEHVHLLINPMQPEYEMSQIRKAIKSPVARTAIDYIGRHAPNWLPRITRQRGGKSERLFWQSGGGYDRNVTRDKTLLAVIDYIHFNPVRRGLAEKPIDWKWSSATGFLNLTNTPLAVDRIPADWLLEP